MGFAIAASAACLIFTSLSVRSADSWQLGVSQADLKQIADGALTLMSFTVLPDVTTASLTIRNDNLSEGNPGIWQTTLGGGFTVSRSVPLYLEGTLGYNRYDPVFIASRGGEQRRIPVKWNSFAATGGVGWDFPVNADGSLVVRPIFNFTLGYVATDATIAQAIVNDRFDTEFEIVDGGRMGAYGLGGSLMLDYELIRDDYEVDVELRYSYIGLRSIGGTTSGLDGESETNSAGVWARWRAPTGIQLMQRPLRYVLETSHTRYYGTQSGALGFDALTSLGAGIEFDSSAYPVVITRTRIVGRYVFGENVRGFSLGLAASF